MTAIEQAIREAVEKGGYAVPNINLYHTDGGKTKKKNPAEIAYEAEFRGMWQVICLDPSFWQALGKARGWGKETYHTETGEEWGKRICNHCGYDTDIQPPRTTGCNHAYHPEACDVCNKNTATWRDQWHRFIDHLAQGKDAESFFAGL